MIHIYEKEESVRQRSAVDARHRRREFVWWAASQGYSRPEIAQMAGCSVRTVAYDLATPRPDDPDLNITLARGHQAVTRQDETLRGAILRIRDRACAEYRKKI